MKLNTPTKAAQRRHRDALQRAIDIAGSQAKLADAINIKRKRITGKPTVSMWLKRGCTPAEFCPSIERATGVPCEQLNELAEWDVVRSKAK